MNETWPTHVLDLDGSGSRIRIQALGGGGSSFCITLGQKVSNLFLHRQPWIVLNMGVRGQNPEGTKHQRCLQWAMLMPPGKAAPLNNMYKINRIGPPWTNVSKNTVISMHEEFIPALTRFLLDTRTALKATELMFKNPHLIFLKGSCVNFS